MVYSLALPDPFLPRFLTELGFKGIPLIISVYYNKSVVFIGATFTSPLATSSRTLASGHIYKSPDRMCAAGGF